jgi:hypothetical protein
MTITPKRDIAGEIITGLEEIRSGAPLKTTYAPSATYTRDEALEMLVRIRENIRAYDDDTSGDWPGDIWKYLDEIDAVIARARAPRSHVAQHQWDRDGERCLKCGDKDWMGGQCRPRPCTCHPDDNPPVPCQHRYAITECRAAAEGRETVEEVLEVVGTYGPWGRDINEGLRYQIVLADEVKRLRADNSLPADILSVCRERGWNLHWTHRGAYLHLEASELIEALRGKRGDPLHEAADVLLVLMSITQSAGLPWRSVLDTARSICEEKRTQPRYKGEEFDPSLSSSTQQPEDRMGEAAAYCRDCAEASKQCGAMALAAAQNAMADELERRAKRSATRDSEVDALYTAEYSMRCAGYSTAADAIAEHAENVLRRTDGTGPANG